MPQNLISKLQPKMLNNSTLEKASTVNISEEEYQILKQAAKDNAATAKKLKDLQNKYLQLKEELHAPGGS